MSQFTVRNTVVLALLLGGVALSFPVFGEKNPQSLLPPGFNQPPARPQDADQKPEPKHDLLDELKLNTPPAQAPQKKDNASADTDALGNAVAAIDNSATIPATAYDLAPEARRSLAQIGLIGPDAGGLTPHAFGAVDGRALEHVMRHTRAPIASRWVSIVLRRTLLSDVATPVHVNGADWVAERAWLLLRMGEADSARMLIQRVDTDNYTPKLIAVAMQSALASADLTSICPLVPQAMKASDEPSWRYSRAICAALSGESASASSLLRQANDNSGVQDIDKRLSQRVVGAGKNTRQAVTIEWDDVHHLTAWRFGTATSVGLPIPASLYETVRPNVRAWAARAPLLPLKAREDAVNWAAAFGIFSNAALVDYYSSLADEEDASRDDNSPQALLRTAYVGDTEVARATAMQSLWTTLNLDSFHQYARLILTARAAARMPIDPSMAKYVDALEASMLTTGLDVQAQRWAGVAQNGSDDVSKRAWGLLAVGAPNKVVTINAGRISSYRSTGDLRSRFLVAALIGLGRIDSGQAAQLAGEFNVDIAHKTIWSRAIDAAAARGEAGSVVLLAAAGMQSLYWNDVQPEYLFHIVAAFKKIGLEPEARMVAAEALTRA